MGRFVRIIRPHWERGRSGSVNPFDVIGGSLGRGTSIMTSLLRQIALRHRRSGVLLAGLAVFVAALAPATASAQRCPVGVDISAAQDRYPSACARFELPPGLRAVGPTA
ncbi:MAG: hypothetical protein QOH11_3279, partial [Solirubrobacteraceae bacterium]|nr:hypothetical protein [Solirubrobacteraceae bacterium]